MRIKLAVTLDVDEESWEDAYGVSRAKVPQDVRNYLTAVIERAMGADRIGTVTTGLSVEIEAVTTIPGPPEPLSDYVARKGFLGRPPGNAWERHDDPEHN